MSCFISWHEFKGSQDRWCEICNLPDREHRIVEGRLMGGSRVPVSVPHIIATVDRTADGQYRASIGPCEVSCSESGTTLRTSCSGLTATTDSREAAISQVLSMFHSFLFTPVFTRGSSLEVKDGQQ